MTETTVTLYVARLHDGQFSRGEGWVDNIANARLYRRIGPAKSAVTKWVKQNPGLPIPEILEWKLDIATATVVNVAGETQKRIGRAAKAKVDKEERYRRERIAYLEEQGKRLEEERARLMGAGGRNV